MERGDLKYWEGVNLDPGRSALIFSKSVARESLSLTCHLPQQPKSAISLHRYHPPENKDEIEYQAIRRWNTEQTRYELEMSNPRYLSIKNIHFLAFVNKKIKDSIFGRFFHTFANQSVRFALIKNVFSIKQNRFAWKKMFLPNKKLRYDSIKMFF